MPRRYPLPAEKPVRVDQMLKVERWRPINWRRGTKGPLHAHFAARCARIADGARCRSIDGSYQHLPGDELWLIGERRVMGEKKYHLSNLPPETPLRTLTATVKARWIGEQAHQQMKEELGLDHFEGRSWTGLHRHALMTIIAFAFLQHQRLIQAKREKIRLGPPPSPSLPAVRQAIAVRLL